MRSGKPKRHKPNGLTYHFYFPIRACLSLGFDNYFCQTLRFYVPHATTTFPPFTNQTVADSKFQRKDSCLLRGYHYKREIVPFVAFLTWKCDFKIYNSVYVLEAFSWLLHTSPGARPPPGAQRTSSISAKPLINLSWLSSFTTMLPELTYLF